MHDEGPFRKTELSTAVEFDRLKHRIAELEQFAGSRALCSGDALRHKMQCGTKELRRLHKYIWLLCITILIVGFLAAMSFSEHEREYEENLHIQNARIRHLERNQNRCDDVRKVADIILGKRGY